MTGCFVSHYLQRISRAQVYGARSRLAPQRRTVAVTSVLAQYPSHRCCCVVLRRGVGRRSEVEPGSRSADTGKERRLGRLGMEDR